MSHLACQMNLACTGEDQFAYDLVDGKNLVPWAFPCLWGVGETLKRISQISNGGPLRESGLSCSGRNFFDCVVSIR